MAFFVYIIQRQVDASCYRGFSEQPWHRLRSHNNAEAAYTKNKIPWTLVYLEIYPTKRDALIRERRIKKYSQQQIQQLIAASKNRLTDFL